MKKTNPIIEYIRPQAIVDFKLCEQKKNLIKKYPPIHSFETDKCAKLKANGYIIFDFAKEYSGGLRILTAFIDGSNNASLRIRFGESLGEVYQEVGIKGATNDHSPRDFVVNVPNLSDLTFGQSGFRFARIDNISGHDVLLRSVLLSYQHVGLKVKAYFRSDDETINRIFDVASRTAYMCVQNGFLVEAIKRDRLVWSGDLYVQLKSTLDLLGGFDVISNTLDSLIKVNSLGKWMNNIPSYSLWYLLNVSLFYQFSGNKNWLKKHINFITGVVNQISQCICEDGHLEFNLVDHDASTGMKDFIDWSSPQNDDANIALNSFAVYVLKETAKLFENHEFIDEIINRIKVKPLNENVTKGVRALYELGIHHNPSSLLLNDVKTTSTFMAYPIYHVLSKNDYTNEALNQMKKYYGGMLDLNASTFFEAFDLSWVGGKVDLYEENKPYFHADYGEHCYVGYRLSLCHAWSSGPVPFLLEDVAGITLIDSNTYMINPKPGSLKHIEAGLMSKKGLIEVVIDNNGGNITYQVKAPNGITIIKK